MSSKNLVTQFRSVLKMFSTLISAYTVCYRSDVVSSWEA